MEPAVNDRLPVVRIPVVRIPGSAPGDKKAPF
jgi:hypothetical protein